MGTRLWTDTEMVGRWYACVLSVSLLVAASPAVASGLIGSLEAGQQRKIVFMGTSLTAGDVWPALVGDWLTERYPGQVTLVNSGVPGSESSDGVRDLQTLVLDHHPDVVMIEYSMNDAWAIGEGYPEKISPEQSAANLNYIIDQILAQNATAEIILQTTNAGDNPHRPRLPVYYGVTRTVAAERGLQVIDQYPVWADIQVGDPDWYATYVPDGVHPKALAWEQVAFPIIQSDLLQECFTVGDANLDGFVDDSDLSLLLANWRTGRTWGLGNCGGVGVTDDCDLSLLLANWTGVPAPVAVPEPSTGLLLAIGAMAVICGLGRRRCVGTLRRSGRPGPGGSC